MLEPLGVFSQQRDLNVSTEANTNYPKKKREPILAPAFFRLQNYFRPEYSWYVMAAVR